MIFGKQVPHLFWVKCAILVKNIFFLIQFHEQIHFSRSTQCCNSSHIFKGYVCDTTRLYILIYLHHQTVCKVAFSKVYDVDQVERLVFSPVAIFIHRKGQALYHFL